MPHEIMDDAAAYETLDAALRDGIVRMSSFNGEYRKLKGIAMNSLIASFGHRISDLTLEDSEYFRPLLGKLLDGRSIDYYGYDPIQESWLIEGQDCRFAGINDQNRFGNIYTLDLSNEFETFSIKSLISPGGNSAGTNPKYSVLCDGFKSRNLRGLYLSSASPDSPRAHEILLIRPAKKLDELLCEIGDWPFAKVRAMLPSVC